MPYELKADTPFYTYEGVEVYHVWKDGFAHSPMIYHYSTQPDTTDESLGLRHTFDIRDIEWSGDASTPENHRFILRKAIVEGSLRPATGYDPSREMRSMFLHNLVLRSVGDWVMVIGVVDDCDSWGFDQIILSSIRVGFHRVDGNRYPDEAVSKVQKLGDSILYRRVIESGRIMKTGLPFEVVTRRSDG